MKKFLVYSGLLSVFSLFLSIGVSAQGTTVLTMKDGSTVEGYIRSQFYSTISHIEMSEEPTGKTKKYDLDDIKKITMYSIDGDSVLYVRRYRYRLFKSHNKPHKGYYKQPVLFRLDYASPKGVELLTEIRRSVATSGMRTAAYKELWTYVKLQGENAARPLCAVIVGSDKPEEANFRIMARRAFADYPSLVIRINGGEFSAKNPLRLIKAYEELIY
ncbi:MAG TPA: hypothetical protein IAA13_03955 [Candidatus Alistipes merdigallinarum]|nr:hypothetical protein [Candidatus Alistipes merdigallinarum]